MSRRVRGGSLALALPGLLGCILAGCTGSTTANLVQAPVPAHRGPAGDLLQQVRSAGQVGVELDVQPLRDPQVADLRAAATEAEARRDFDAARASVDQALQLAPDDPDLLQWRAELFLERRDFDDAARLAQRSYDTGPKSGGLCRRNLATIRLAAEARGDAARAAEAGQLAAACKIAPPVRM